MINSSMDSKITEQIHQSSKNMYKALLVAFIVLCFGLSLRMLNPTGFYDNINFDYDATAASHALLFAANAAGDPNGGNLNINSHPGVPYYFAMGLTRIWIGEGDSKNATDRILYFFNNIDDWWTFQGWLAAVIASIGAFSFAMYARNAPILLQISLFSIPLVYIAGPMGNALICNISNETFTMPMSASFMIVASTILNAEKPKLWQFLLLGFLAGVAYSIKLPYIGFFAGGFGVLLLAYIKFRPSLYLLLQYTVSYCIGFCLLFPILIMLFDMSTVKNILRYHYNVLTHSGFAGGGEDTIATIDSIAINFDQYLNFLRKMKPLSVLMILSCVALLWKKHFYKLRWYNIACISSLLIIFSIVVIKHWGLHYALIIPVLLAFLFYELLRPFLQERIPFVQYGLITLAAIFLLGQMIKPTRVFSEQLENIVQARTEKENFLLAIDRLPLKPNQSIYFLWGTHRLPLFISTHALGLTYIHGDSRYTAFRKMYPKHTFQSYISYPKEKNTTEIAYIVVEKWRINHSEEGKPFVSWDAPHPRFSKEPGDEIVLEWSNFAVLKKARPLRADEIDLVETGG